MNKEPIRILHWGLENSRGGIEAFIMDLYRNVDRTKVQFDFLEPHDMDELIYEDEINEMGGKVYRVLYSKRESCIKSRTCLTNFLKEHPEIKGMHVHASFLYASILKDAYKAGLPIRILHSHSSKCGEKEGVKYKLRKFFVQKEIYKYPTDYFSCSDLATQFMFPDKEAHWIRNGIDVNKFDYDVLIRNEVRSELNIKDEIVLGFVGNLRIHKNPLFVIKIFEQYNRINKKSKLLLIGSGVMENELKKYVHEQGLTKDVIFAGVQKDTYKFYQAMDVFVFPSLFEGLPVVLVEAQTSGLPCLVSDSITRQIAVTDCIEYLPISQSAEYWANKIEDTLINYERQSCKEEIIDAGFDIKVVAKRMEEYYLKIYNQTR